MISINLLIFIFVSYQKIHPSINLFIASCLLQRLIRSLIGTREKKRKPLHWRSVFIFISVICFATNCYSLNVTICPTRDYSSVWPKCINVVPRLWDRLKKKKKKISYLTSGFLSTSGHDPFFPSGPQARYCRRFLCVRGIECLMHK